MNVSDLNLSGLFEQMEGVRTLLSTPSAMKSLLDHARADTPIIDEIYTQIVVMLQSKPRRHHKKMLEVAERDLYLFLALRDLAREQHEKAESRLRAAMN